MMLSPQSVLTELYFERNPATEGLEPMPFKGLSRARLTPLSVLFIVRKVKAALIWDSAAPLSI
jgi:hypothetical protein